MTVKPYRDLTRRERLFRFRALAKKALEAYGLRGAQIRFIQYNENIIYGVFLKHPVTSPEESSSTFSDRYILRIHAMGDEEAIASELNWLDAMVNEANLPVPAPVYTLDGQPQIKIVTEGLPQGRVVSLLRWMKGRKLEKGIKPVHLKALGRVTAQLHAFSKDWHPPAGFKRPIWDWDAQLGGTMFDTPRQTLIDSMPHEFQEPFETVSCQAKAAMESLGVRADAFGLIHADLYPENVLFNAGQAHPIDFEDCGYGYWIWDIAVALCTWAWKEGWEQMRDAFYDGYQEVRQLPEKQWEFLDLFIATQYATMLLWASAFLVHDPIRINEYEPWRDDSGRRLLDYFRK